MTTAVSIGQCVQGDKEKPELMDMLNEGYAVDLSEFEGDDATGAGPNNIDISVSGGPRPSDPAREGGEAKNSTVGGPGAQATEPSP